MEFLSPYPGLEPGFIASHFPFSGSEPVLVLELHVKGTSLWTPAFASLRPEARFIVFASDEAAEQEARQLTAGISSRVRFLRADWFSGIWETKLPAGFHVIWALGAASGAAYSQVQILAGRLAAKLREGGMLFWGEEIRPSSPVVEADYERRLEEYRKGKGIPFPAANPERDGVPVTPRPNADQVRRWMESAGLSNVDLLWKQELASVTTGMKKV